MCSLAVVILTKNEEDNIEQVVNNAKQCTEEVLLIDGGSTDRTVDLAQKCGAKVCFRAWDADFSAQRNFALDQTDAKWILYLDADERLNKDLVPFIKKVVQSATPDKQYLIQRKSVAFGTKFNHGILEPDFVARLFPRGSVTWVNKVHEHPVCNLPSVQLPGHIEHHTYRDWAAWERKLEQYTTIWAQNAYAQGKKISMPGILLHSLAAFIKMFILKKGFLDGWMGSYMCCTHFFYTMLKYLKLQELWRLNREQAKK